MVSFSLSLSLYNDSDMTGKLQMEGIMEGI